MRMIFASAAIFLLSQNVFAFEYSGRVNTWSLFQTDDLSSTRVAVITDDATKQVIGVAVGSDIAIECAVAGRTCTYREIGDTGELDIERITDAGRSKKGEIGDTLLWNLGVDAKGSHKDFAGKIQGNFTTSLLNDRSLYGHDKYRFRFTSLYGEYNQDKYRLRLGRQAVTGGVLLDGASADYFFGPAHARDQKSLGFFAGLAPNPISKHPSKDFITFGPKVQWIPSFSESGDTKLFVESSLVTELYKMKMDRFYLYSRVHFTPIRQFSTILYSTLELPWSGSDGSIKSSLLSFQNFWRPTSRWFFSIGFSQFRIERHLQDEAVRWVTENAAQSTRVGETLDRSQRYRVDARASFKVTPEVQPFVKGRYERRSFDKNKINLNSDPTTPATTNFSLQNQKNAYQGTAGVRLFLFDHLDTETSGTYGQRFQSKFYSLFQSAMWEMNQDWSADAYFQYVSSRRTTDPSRPSGVGLRETATDWYVGIGGSYRFLSDFLAQIRYDLSNEDDAVLDRSLMFHTVLVRIDYSF